MDISGLKILKGEEAFAGLRVVDSEGDRGSISNCSDLHNVEVTYEDGLSMALFCLVDECREDPKDVVLYILKEEV